VTVALVSSTGGHLAELIRLRRRFDGIEDVRWVTFDSPQSRSLLQGQDPIFVRETGPRQVGAAAINAAKAARLLREHDISAVVSTGAAVALSFMVPARKLGLPCVYIESAARIRGPSLTAKLLRFVPGVRLYTQYAALQTRRWHFAGSVFDGYRTGPGPAPADALKVVVMLGSLQGFQFRRLVDRLVDVLPPSAQVTWQTGATDVGDLSIAALAFMPESELRGRVEAADVVVSHAGIGSALMAFDSGRLPVLVPRLRRHGEHVDDHQEEVADELARRGLAISTSAESLSLDHLQTAACSEITDRGTKAIILPLGE
jgi:UDP-N-acetylglucosamine--N-acetylmuramyl-(pentapeptide) pyrophosphoryl-undecaprenol N-acetylglucosamine transferase